MARVIFVEPRNEVGGALSFFRAIAGSRVEGDGCMKRAKTEGFQRRF
jgi:hypothetical protein